jgi:DNA-binding beta-propeller fold protein YncE
MSDPNNRPGGPHLIVTAKTANKVQFFDAATLALTAEIDMPASTHEMIRSPDGGKVFASVYGGGIFGKNTDPDRRIAVVDLAARALERMIDVGDAVAPHGVMMAGGMLWVTAELGGAVLAIEPGSGHVERIAIGGRAHWVAAASGQVFASCKTSDVVVVIDAATRKPAGTIHIPNLAEGLAVSPDGETLFVCAHRKGEIYAFDARTRALRKTMPIDGAPGSANQLRRVRVSPDGRHVVASSLLDCHVAIYQADTLTQIGSLATRKAPMGFGFAADGRHAFVCCHDDAIVMEFELSTGRATREFRTASGCEFIISY